MMIKMLNIFKKKNKVPDTISYYNNLLSSVKENPYGFDNKYANQEATLLKMYGTCKQFQKSIKMIVITDTHNCININDFSNFIKKHSYFDICLLLGDHNSNDIEIILKYIDKDKIYALLGNHDYNYIEEYELHNLNGNIININGVKLLGIQGSFKYKPSDFPSFTQKESIEFLNSKESVDILVSHDNRFDSSMIGNPAHQGLFGITYYLFKNRVPYHIHGHVHNPYRNEMVNGTKEISSYMYEYIELK